MKLAQISSSFFDAVTTLKINKKIKLVALVIFFIIVICSISYYRYKNYLESRKSAYLNDAYSIYSLVSKQYSLISGDFPVILSVEDLNRLPKDDFLNRASFKDRLYLFRESNLGAIYRKETNQIIYVSALPPGRANYYLGLARGASP